MAIADNDRISLLIDGEEFTGWNTIDIHLSMDAYSSIDFTAPFEPSNKAFRRVFTPFTFKPVEVKVADVTLFKGTCVGIDPEGDANSNTVKVSAYSLPGTLEDCTLPAEVGDGGSKKPPAREFKGLKLRTIAERLVAPFGLEVEFRGDDGPAFKLVKIDIDKEVSKFIAELARLRGRVISNTIDGKMLCWQAVAAGSPVARLVADEQPTGKVSAKFNPQAVYSEITGFGRAKRHRGGSRYTELNPFLRTILRPQAFRMDNTEKGDAADATRARMSRMFANMATWSADLATWRDPQGKLWTPNTTLMLTAPTAMVYRETEMLVRNVTLHQDKDNSSASHDYVLPGTFSGEIPKVLPWLE